MRARARGALAYGGMQGVAGRMPPSKVCASHRWSRRDSIKNSMSGGIRAAAPAVCAA
jgi:hypothetical protein